MKKNLNIIIILGAAWGIFEATAGYLLHMGGLRMIGWMIWFPVAYFFIHKAYSYTKDIPSVMFTALIASSLKLINLFFPGRIDMVLNPAAAIILEALSVMLVYKYIVNRRTSGINPLDILLTGFIWRSLYICYILSMPQYIIEIAPFNTMNSFLEFMFLNNVVNALFISIGLRAAKALSENFRRVSGPIKAAINNNAVIKPAAAVVSLVLAIIIQVAAR